VTTARALDPKHFALGERFPEAVHAPDSVEALGALVRDCNARQRAIVFFGGGTLQGLGHVPERYDVAIRVGRINRVLEYDHRDLTIAVEAGCTLAALGRALAAHGQFLPLDAPRSSQATVGGTLAGGWLGPRRSAYGSPRDFVIGTSVVLADGSVAKAGGMVVKNVTGYDLSKLYLGSLGTLGALVRVNFKTLPIPQTRRLAFAPLPEGTRGRALKHVAALSIEPAAALAVSGFSKEIDGTEGPDGRVIVLLEGSPRSVESATRELRSALGSAGVPETRLVDSDVEVAFERIVDAYVASLGARSATYRSGGLPGDATPRSDAFVRVAQSCKLKLETIEDIRSGDVIARLSTATTRDLEERLVSFDAERRTALAGARVLAAPQAVRARLDAWGALPASLATMRALKAQFDPNCTLAPGRYVGRI